MRRYLVTGGAGFIGSHLTRALLDGNNFVRVLDNFSSGKRENLEGVRLHEAAGRLEVVEGDLRDLARVAGAVQGIDIVFQEAAFVSVAESLEQPTKCFDININGTSILMEAARKAGVRRVVLASSAAVYGNNEAVPLVEDMPLQPLSPYAVSKGANGMLCPFYTASFGLEGS